VLQGSVLFPHINSALRERRISWNVHARWNHIRFVMDLVLFILVKAHVVKFVCSCLPKSSNTVRGWTNRPSRCSANLLKVEKASSVKLSSSPTQTRTLEALEYNYPISDIWLLRSSRSPWLVQRASIHKRRGVVSGRRRCRH
jgi:hypothetical protein